MWKDFRKDPRTVISRQGDQIVVSLPDGTVQYAKDAREAWFINNRWLGMPNPEQPPGVGIRYTTLEWVGVEPWEPPPKEQKS
jgi:hypothetical protein